MDRVDLACAVLEQLDKADYHLGSVEPPMMTTPCCGGTFEAGQRYHAQLKERHWGAPAFFGQPRRGNGLEYRECLACGSTLAVRLAHPGALANS